MAMETWKTIGRPISIGFGLAFTAWSQSNPDTPETNPPNQSKEKKHEPGAAREIGAGAGAIGVGAAKGTGAAAKGAAKGAADLVTLHPIDAGVSVGKGAATAGKDVTVGAAKGTGKITKGIGRVFKKLF
jgi:hypothetical protein